MRTAPMFMCHQVMVVPWNDSNQSVTMWGVPVIHGKCPDLAAIGNGHSNLSGNALLVNLSATTCKICCKDKDWTGLTLCM